MCPTVLLENSTRPVDCPSEPGTYIPHNASAYPACTFNLLFNVSSRECKMNKLCLSYKSNLILHVLKPNLNSHSFVPLTVNICETPVKNVDVSNRSKRKKKKLHKFHFSQSIHTLSVFSSTVTHRAILCHQSSCIARY